MLLVLDIGNTNTVLGIYRGDTLVRSWRLTSEKRTADELSVYLLTLLGTLRVDPWEITGAVMASVVPPLDAPWHEAVKSLCGVRPLEVTASLDLGMPVRLLNPGEVGADRHRPHRRRGPAAPRGPGLARAGQRPGARAVCDGAGRSA